MAQVPGLAACHSRARLAQHGEHWARDLVQGSVCHKPRHRARCKHKRGVGLCSPALHRAGQKNQAVVHGRLQKKPERPLDFLTLAILPVAFQGRAGWPECLHWSPFLAVLKKLWAVTPGEPQTLFPVWLFLLWVGWREKHSLAFLVRRFHSGCFCPCNLSLYHSGKSEMCGGSWNPVWQRRWAKLLSSQ